MCVDNRIKNFFFFLTKPKIYLWKEKFAPPKISAKKEMIEEKPKEGSVLKIDEKSHLGRLSTFLETKRR